MAPANPPTARSAPATKSKSKKLRKKKNRERGYETENQDTDAPPDRETRPPRKDLPAAAHAWTPAPPSGAAPPAPKAQTQHKGRTPRPPLPPAQAPYDRARLDLLDTAIQILQEVLQALRTGTDPIPIVLSGMGKLFQVGS